MLHKTDTFDFCDMKHTPDQFSTPIMKQVLQLSKGSFHGQYSGNQAPYNVPGFYTLYVLYINRNSLQTTYLITLTFAHLYKLRHMVHIPCAFCFNRHNSIHKEIYRKTKYMYANIIIDSVYLFIFFQSAVLETGSKLFFLCTIQQTP